MTFHSCTIVTKKTRQFFGKSSPEKWKAVSNISEDEFHVPQSISNFFFPTPLSGFFFLFIFTGISLNGMRSIHGNSNWLRLTQQQQLLFASSNYLISATFIRFFLNCNHHYVIYLMQGGPL